MLVSGFRNLFRGKFSLDNKTRNNIETNKQGTGRKPTNKG
jgi:hypothetical protein